MKWMTIAVAAAMLTSGTARLNAQDASRFDAPARGRDYVRALIGPAALLGIGAATALDQIRDDPPQWNLGDRALSNAGRNAAQATVQHGIAALMDRSTWYYRCSCTATGSRIGHAFAEAFTDHDRQGGTHFSVARVAGALGGAWAESTWRPGRDSGEILATGASTLVASGFVNVFREFIH